MCWYWDICHVNAHPCAEEKCFFGAVLDPFWKVEWVMDWVLHYLRGSRRWLVTQAEAESPHLEIISPPGATRVKGGGAAQCGRDIRETREPFIRQLIYWSTEVFTRSPSAVEVAWEPACPRTAHHVRCASNWITFKQNSDLCWGCQSS